MEKKITLINLGGTITEVFEGSWLSSRLDQADLKTFAPGLFNGVDVCPSDSCDGCLEQIATVCNEIERAHESDAFVICCGTDAVDEIGVAIAMLAARERPCVLTAAAEPATSERADGPRNLKDAVAVVQSAEGGDEPVFVFGGHIFDVSEVGKVDTRNMNLFGPESAILGSISRGSVQRNRAPRPIAPIKRDVSEIDFSKRVEIIDFHFGGGNCLPALNEVDGLVIATCGNGGINQSVRKELRENYLGRIPVVLSSRCPSGIHYIEGDKKCGFDALLDEGYLIADYAGLSAWKARIKLILALGAGE